MVRKSAEGNTGVATRQSGKVMSWEDEMAKDAELAAAQETLTGGGQFVSLASGVLSVNGAPMANNEMRCIILDAIFENVYYEGDFDRENQTSPTCFAFGRYDKDGKTVISIEGWEGGEDVKGLRPHKSVPERVCDSCEACPMNQFGTAKTGRGKACANRRRLGLIPVQGVTKKGQFIINTQDEEHYATAPMAYLKTPVTSTKVYSAYVTQVASALKRPPYGVFTRVWLTPSDNQFTVNFEAIDSIPSNLRRVITDRHEEAMAAISFPYTMLSEGEDPKKSQPKTKKRGETAKSEAPRGKAAQPAKQGRGRF